MSDGQGAPRFPRENGGKREIVIGEIMSEIGSRNTCCVTTAAAFFSRARPSSDSSQSCLVGFTQPGTEHSRGNAKWGGGAEDRGEKPIRASRMRQMEEVAATREQRKENGGSSKGRKAF